MLYQFDTSTTMKEYNSNKYWIDRNIIKTIRINADSLNDALKQYQKTVKEKTYIEISDNALKNKNPMYIDDDNSVIQTGYVITASTEISDDNYNYTKQYIDLWVEINIIVSPFTEGGATK